MKSIDLIPHNHAERLGLVVDLSWRIFQSHFIHKRHPILKEAPFQHHFANVLSTIESKFKTEQQGAQDHGRIDVYSDIEAVELVCESQLVGCVGPGEVDVSVRIRPVARHDAPMVVGNDVVRRAGRRTVLPRRYQSRPARRTLQIKTPQIVAASFVQPVDTPWCVGPGGTLCSRRNIGIARSDAPYKKRRCNSVRRLLLNQAEGTGLEPATPCGAPHFQCGR